MTRRVLLPPRRREVRDPATGHQATHQAAGHRRAAFLVAPRRRRAVCLGRATFLFQQRRRLVEGRRHGVVRLGPATFLLAAVRLEEERRAGQEAAAAAMLAADVTDAAALDHA
jgi:hypothetical protein